MTAKEEVLARFQEARQKKRDCIARLEKSMKADYEKRTGKTPDYFFALWTPCFWSFSSYKRKALFTMLSSSIVDSDGMVNYATLILRNDNPRFAQVMEEYSKSIQLLSQKP